MWEPEKPEPVRLPELEQYLSQPVPGLALLRYKSPQAFDALLSGLRQHDAGRTLHEVRYRPRARDERSSAAHLVQRCRELAGSAIPVIFLRPEPDAEAGSDLEAQAVFWKTMNASREALGALAAQIILTLDEAQTAACYHHAKDLVSWCSPKFEFTPTLPTQGIDRLNLTIGKPLDTGGSASSPLVWRSLHPLFLKEVSSGQPLSPRAVVQLLFPLMQAALDNGAVTLARSLLPAGDRASFPDERKRSRWLELKGELAVMEGDLVGALVLYTESKAIAEYLAASDPTHPELQRDLSVSLNKLGDLAVAQGDLSEAFRYFTQSHAILERLAASDPASTEWRRDLCVSLSKLGDLAMTQGDLPGALSYFTENHAILERLAASDPGSAECQRDLSVSLNKLGDLAVTQGDLAGASRHFIRSQAIREHLAASDPANAKWQRDVTVSLERLGDLAVAQGDLSAALRYFTQRQSITERLAGSDPANAGWQRDLSVSLNKLGDLAVGQGDLAGASRCFSQSKAIAERLAASDPANAQWQRDLTVSHFKLFQFAQKKGDEAMMKTELYACYAVLDGMKQRGLHLDPSIAQIHGQLAGMFGGN